MLERLVAEVGSLWRAKRLEVFEPPVGFEQLTVAEPSPYEHVEWEQLVEVLRGVRRGECAVRLGAQMKLPSDLVQQLVIGVGSRLGRQRVGRVGPSLKVEVGAVGGAQHVDGVCVVVLPASWDPSRAARGYAAVFLAPWDVVVARAEAWWSSVPGGEVPLSYFHFSHLWAAAAGKLPSINGWGVKGPEAAAYVEAWQLLRGKVEQGGDLVVGLVSGEVSSGVEDARWLLDGFVTIWQHCAQRGDEVGMRKLRVGLAKQVLEHPSRFFPRGLGEIPQQHFWALVSSLGFSHESTGDGEAARPPFMHLETVLRRQIAEFGVDVYRKLGVLT